MAIVDQYTYCIWAQGNPVFLKGIFLGNGYGQRRTQWLDIQRFFKWLKTDG
jgi:hypothetical protein